MFFLPPLATFVADPLERRQARVIKCVIKAIYGSLHNACRDANLSASECKRFAEGLRGKTHLQVSPLTRMNQEFWVMYQQCYRDEFGHGPTKES
jgi:hypothetical protein